MGGKRNRKKGKRGKKPTPRKKDQKVGVKTGKGGDVARNEKKKRGAQYGKFREGGPKGGGKEKRSDGNLLIFTLCKKRGVGLEEGEGNQYSRNYGISKRDWKKEGSSANQNITERRREDHRKIGAPNKN